MCFSIRLYGAVLGLLLKHAGKLYSKINVTFWNLEKRVCCVLLNLLGYVEIGAIVLMIIIKDGGMEAKV